MPGFYFRLAAFHESENIRAGADKFFGTGHALQRKAGVSELDSYVAAITYA